jgi:DNA-binding MarR family transcriptional regulator
MDHRCSNLSTKPGASLKDESLGKLQSSAFNDDDDTNIAWIERVLPHLSHDLLGRTLLDEQFAKLPIAQFRLIKALPNDEIGETMGRLSEKIRIKASALTQTADRIIRQGLVERVSAPEDRRIVRLRLTTQGRQWNEERQAHRRARLELIWRGIAPHERDEFIAAVQTLERIGRLAETIVSNTEHQNISKNETNPSQP